MNGILNSFLTDLQELEHIDYSRRYDYTRMKTWVTRYHKTDISKCRLILKEICTYNTYIASKCIEECIEGYDELSALIIEYIKNNAYIGHDENKIVTTLLTYLELQRYEDLYPLFDALPFQDAVNTKPVYQFYEKIFTFYHDLRSYPKFLEMIASTRQRIFFSIILEISSLPLEMNKNSEQRISLIIQSLFEHHDYYSMALIIEKVDLHHLENILGDNYYNEMLHEVLLYDEMSSQEMIQIIGAMEIELVMLIDKFNSTTAALSIMRKQFCDKYALQVSSYFKLYTCLRQLQLMEREEDTKIIEKEIQSINDFDYEVIKLRKKPAKVLMDCINHYVNMDYDIVGLITALGDKNYYAFRKGEHKWLYNFPMNLTYPYVANRCLEHLMNYKVPLKNLLFIYMNTHYRTLIPIDDFIQNIYDQYIPTHSLPELIQLFQPYSFAGVIEKVEANRCELSFRILQCNQKVSIRLNDANRRKYRKGMVLQTRLISYDQRNHLLEFSEL